MSSEVKLGELSSEAKSNWRRNPISGRTEFASELNSPSFTSELILMYQTPH
jgi:hypothetical protein